MSTLARAIEIAVEAHKGQTDKQGMPYIGHPMRVMQAGKTEDEKIVGILHDVVEDTPWTFEQLEAEGFSEKVIEAIQLLTKADDEDYDLYIERVKSNPLAISVKINDLTDNMDLRRYCKLSDNTIARLRKYHKAYCELVKGDSLY